MNRSTRDRWARFLISAAVLLCGSGPVAAAEEFDDCAGASWCPRMVVVPAGTFVMGSPATEKGRYPDEGQRQVTIRRFAVAKYDVTRAQFAAFAKATRRTTEKGCFFAVSKKPSWKDPGFPQEDDHPVVCISWPEAQTYVKWLGKKSGKPYRLLTDAEWEYAARAGTTTAFPWGAEGSHEFAKYGAETPYTPMVLGRDRWLHTSPVGSFPPNAFGLYDMHGNVFQWVQDCYLESGDRPPADGSALDPVDCRQRVARGGVWGDTAAAMRSAARNYAPPDDKTPLAAYRNIGFGFRVARSLP